MARKSKELENIVNTFSEYEKIDENELEELEVDCNFIYDLQANAIYISDKKDIYYVQHSVESIILTVIYAIIANCNTFVQIYLFMIKHFEWLQKHIIFDNDMPSLSPTKRVVSFIDHKELEKVCTEH